jgi:non-haem Fe2+, alpha-ketoglutarate-dependent halogenase
VPDRTTRYRRDGIVFPIAALTADEVSRYAEAVDRHLRDDAGDIRRLHVKHEWAHRLATHPAVVAASEELLGEPATIWGTLIIRKAPHSEELVAWHQDGAYASFSGDDAVSAWIALSDSTAEAGCMRVLAGSHERRLAHRNSGDARNVLREGHTVDVPIDESKAIDVILKAGEMSLHHFDLIHGSGPNRSDAPRTGFIVRYLKRSAAG